MTSARRLSWCHLLPGDPLRRAASSLLLPVVVLALAGCGPKSAPDPLAPEVVARVGTRDIRVTDLEAEAARRVAAGQPVPPKEQLLAALVDRESMITRALQAGMDRDPEVRRSWENLLIGRLRESELRSRLDNATVSPEAIRAATPAEPRRPAAQLHLAVLRFGSGRALSDERREELTARLREVRERVPRLAADERGFGELAVNASDDQASRYAGGDVGWFDVGVTNARLPAAVMIAATALGKPGEMTDVIRTERGLFLVRLMERREAGEAALAGQSPAVHQRLLREERRRIEDGFLADTRRMAGVEIRESVLETVSLDRVRQTAAVSVPPPALP